MTELTHGVQFLQAAFTILLSLAFGEAFKQLVPDGDKDMRWDRVGSLIAFVFMIFPFFHGMTRHFFTTYLAHPNAPLGDVAPHLMFDGIMFLLMSATFFVMSRSLSPDHWSRFFSALAVLLLVDTAWSLVVIWRGINVWNFVYLNAALGFALLLIALRYRNTDQSNIEPKFSWGPSFYCAVSCMGCTLVDYYLMYDFFFSRSGAV